jgi:hypothetical protein
VFPNCREMSRHTSDLVEHALPFWRRPGVFLHYLLCQVCRRYRTQIRWLHTAPAAQVAQRPPPSTLSPEARLRLKQQLTTSIQSENGLAPKAPMDSAATHPNSDG